MSRELFEKLRPYIQSMLDAQQSNPSPEPNPEDNSPEPVPYIYSAVQFQDNETGEWHRVFLYDGKMYLESSVYEEPVGGGRRPRGVPGRPFEPALGSDEVLLEDAEDLLLDNRTVTLTTLK